MRLFRFEQIFSIIAGVAILLLAGCGGGTSTTTTTPSPTTFQLTVTGPVTGTGAVTSTPAGINCPSTCAVTFAQNTQVTLTETPAAGYTFTGWGGACSGTGSCVVTLGAAASVTATFSQALTPQLIVSVTGSGMVTSSPAGINCPTVCSASFAQNSSVTLTATPVSGYTFSGWSGACTGAGACSVTISAATAVTANFTQLATPQINLTVSGPGTVVSAPAGINCPGACSAIFPQGAQVTLTATANSGDVFAGWSGACASSSSSCVLSVTGTLNVSATFAPPVSAPLAVTVSGPGSVVSTPAGINCPGACSANFQEGEQVTLTAAPSAGYGLGSWTGSCSGNTSCVITIGTQNAVTATFTKLGTVTVSVIGAGTGTVTSNPAGISCPGTCSATFANNTKVTLTETPDSKSTFAGWTGVCAANNPTCVVTVTNSTSDAVEAAFGLTLQTAINHIIFLAQENRSLDHYFGALPQYWANDNYVHYKNQAFDGLPQFPLSAPSGPAPTNPTCDTGATIASGPYGNCPVDAGSPQITAYHLATMCVENPSPSWNESHEVWNLFDPVSSTATMDGAVATAAHDSLNNGFSDTMGKRVIGYYDGDDLNYYYYMASNFATSDRWFSPTMSRTDPNREFLIAGTSAGYAYPNGSDAKDNALITSPIIFEKLQNAGVSWKVYVYPDPLAHDYTLNNQSLQCVANDIRPECLYEISYLNNFSYGLAIVSDPVLKQNIVPISQFYSDAANGTLPQVAQIEPASAVGLDEHPADFDPTPQNPNPCCSVQAGAAYVKGLVDAVMGTPASPSPSWKDSVFVLTYDEFGGFYDHVPSQPLSYPGDFSAPIDLMPGDVCTNQSQTGPNCNFNYTGFRVPLIVISPFTKQNFVSHAVADNTAILKLIEDRFGLPPLTARDSFQLHMGVEFLDFVNEPWATPPSPPSQNTGGPCYLDHLP